MKTLFLGQNLLSRVLGSVCRLKTAATIYLLDDDAACPFLSGMSSWTVQRCLHTYTPETNVYVSNMVQQLHGNLPSCKQCDIRAGNFPVDHGIPEGTRIKLIASIKGFTCTTWRHCTCDWESKIGVKGVTTACDILLVECIDSDLPTAKIMTWL